MSSFRIALVQPVTALPPDNERNVAAAIRRIEAAPPTRRPGQGVLSEQWQRPDLSDSCYPRPAAPAPRQAVE
jgi:hypothetical protein